jgi:hypothetical protein
MSVPPPIDPRLLAAEIEASVAEFNRLAALAASMHIAVVAEVVRQAMTGGPDRALISVQVIAPL